MTDHPRPDETEREAADELARLGQEMRLDAECTCTPLPDAEGPCAWCDIHGQPSVAWRQGSDEGRRNERVIANMEIRDLGDARNALVKELCAKVARADQGWSRALDEVKEADAREGRLRAELAETRTAMVAFQASARAMRRNRDRMSAGLRKMARRSVEMRRYGNEGHAELVQAVHDRAQLLEEAREASKAYSWTCGGLIRERDQARAESAHRRDALHAAWAERDRLRAELAELRAGQAATDEDEPAHLELYGISGTTDAIADGQEGEARWLLDMAGRCLRDAADIMRKDTELAAPTARPSIPLDALKALAQGEPLDEVAGDYGVPLDVVETVAPWVGRKVEPETPDADAEMRGGHWTLELRDGRPLQSVRLHDWSECTEEECGPVMNLPISHPRHNLPAPTTHPPSEACVHCATPARLASVDPVVDCAREECPHVSGSVRCGHDRRHEFDDGACVEPDPTEVREWLDGATDSGPGPVDDPERVAERIRGLKAVEILRRLVRLANQRVHDDFYDRQAWIDEDRAAWTQARAFVGDEQQ